jgi:putative acetyltransferase
MDILNQVQILPFKPEDQVAVKDLILAGLGDHWGRIDLTKNPDLDDIATYYAGATFLVAWLHGQIIGTGALVPRRNEVAEIVRMSVHKSYRRAGIGGLILQYLVEQAKASRFKNIILETTATWQEVIAFYLKHGFQITHFKDGDVYFTLALDRE